MTQMRTRIRALLSLLSYDGSLRMPIPSHYPLPNHSPRPRAACVSLLRTTGPQLSAWSPYLKEPCLQTMKGLRQYHILIASHSHGSYQHTYPPPPPLTIVIHLAMQEASRLCGDRATLHWIPTTGSCISEMRSLYKVYIINYYMRPYIWLRKVIYMFILLVYITLSYIILH